MPSLQLDVPAAYDAATTRELARRLGAVYAEVMETRPDIVTVVVREASVWRCTDGEPEPGALLMCDVRRGRSAAVRARLCEALVAVCAEVGGVDPARLKVEFTQHDGDEMWHPQLGGFNRDWSAEEA
jgi:phenylpyruvate tautomerase PptA (4-oxalocrotonate tautomerase family)